MSALAKIGETNLLPLYGLAELNERPEASVIVVGSDKCVEAGNKVFPSSVVVASPGEPADATQADWTPLADRRRVVIWPDLDEPGSRYAITVAALLGDLGIPMVLIVDAQRVAEIAPGPKRQAIAGWNVADAVAEGHDPANLRALALEYAVFHKPARVEFPSSGSSVHVELSSADGSGAVTVIKPRAVVTRPDQTVAPLVVTTPTVLARARRPLAPIVLTTAALALSAVGIAINGWFARSLGSSDLAGWLFLAVGVAADVVALVMPSCAARLWQARRRATAMVGWAVWLLAFLFAVTAAVGFASMNISDVTLARANRTTPASTTAQAALADAMAARDRECKVVGKFCRDREAAVAERREILDSAIRTVGQAADPQTDAAIKLVSWVSVGMLRPEPTDFAMFRLLLLALMPQLGGLLMMVGRHSASLNQDGGLSGARA